MRCSAIILGGLAVLAASATGCHGSSGPGVDGHTELVDTLADQVADAGGRDFTANYRFADGAEASVVHTAEPNRTAYRFPDGAYIVTEEYTLTCVDECTLTDGGDPAVPPGAKLLDELGAKDFRAASTVIAPVAELVADGGSEVSSHGRTIAGELATCVSGTGPDTQAVTGRFEVCVTNSGMLGSFDGTIDGEELSISLSGFSRQVDETVFDLPEDVDDNRS